MKQAPGSEFQFDREAQNSLVRMGLSAHTVHQLAQLCSAYRYKMARADAADKELPSFKQRAIDMEEVRASAARLRALLSGDGPQAKQLCIEDWAALHDSCDRLCIADPPINGFDPDRWGAMLEGLRYIEVGAAELSVHLNSLKRKGPKPVPLWRRELVEWIVRVLESDGVAAASGKIKLPEVVEIVFKGSNVPTTARAAMADYSKTKEMPRQSKGKKLGF